MVLIMTSTPVRYPTPNASTGSPQHTSGDEVGWVDDEGEGGVLMSKH